MIGGTLLWMSLVGGVLGFIDSSDLADQLLEFARPVIKSNGDDSISLVGLKTDISDVFGYNMGKLSCENGTLSDLSTITRAGPAIMSKVVLKDDVILSLYVYAKLTTMTLEYGSCDMSILDYPVKNLQPKITIGSNELAIVISVSGSGNACTSKVQKSTVNLFSDVKVTTSSDPTSTNTPTDGFLTGLVQGNQAEIVAGIQKGLYIGLGKALNDAKICDIFDAKKYLG